jgi:glutamine synthetase
VASAGNDHRLGANEAPPAIMSIFLGDQLTDVIEQIQRGGAKRARQGGVLNIGVSSLPPLPRDATDRNRTSPFAFTGSKFEFRAVGADQSCADPNAVLNTIVAESLDGICSRLEADRAAGRDFNASLQTMLQELMRRHERIVFNGDNYTREWHAEAERRGLPKIRTTPEALKAWTAERTVALFEKHGVLSRRELESRYEVYRREYEHIVKIEAACAVTMVKTMIVPFAARYAGELAGAVNEVARARAGARLKVTRAMLRRVADLCESALATTEELEALRDGSPADKLALMKTLRQSVDELEGLVPDHLWPLPSYADMMFMV